MGPEVPEGMNPYLAESLHELRERKIDSELLVKRKAAELMELNSRLQELLVSTIFCFYKQKGA